MTEKIEIAQERKKLVKWEKWNLQNREKGQAKAKKESKSKATINNSQRYSGYQPRGFVDRRSYKLVNWIELNFFCILLHKGSIVSFNRKWNLRWHSSEATSTAY